MFTGKVAGRAEEALEFYLSVFKESRRGMVARYGKGQEPDREGTLMFAGFVLGGQWFAAMDSAHPHGFAFNEAISLLVPCEIQKEIDYYWERLSADPKAEQCGWLKDKFGLSWQIWPTVMDAAEPRPGRRDDEHEGRPADPGLVSQRSRFVKVLKKGSDKSGTGPRRSWYQARRAIEGPA